MMQQRVLLHIALILLVGNVGAQETTPEPTMNEETLLRDIETAGFYELVDWLTTLDLSTSGDRPALARRLIEHYGLVVPPGTEEENSLIVDSAARTRYFTLDDIDERYVRLSGGVTLTLRDDERDVYHQILADEVTYNQDLSILSASGNVVYTLEREGTVEQFTGAALTVQLDDWEGAFVQGVTERPRNIEGEEVDFSFEGSYITRSSDDVVVMDNGRVTSSIADPPNYEIRAEKIWVLAPGEWGLRNAFLYVGRVPVFYFPFFFRPGDELFFNPSVGSRVREGRFIQTTTYLRGEPEEPESAFSFLQIAEEGSAREATKIEGLYLVPDDSPPERARGNEVKLVADYYSSLGFYAAVDGKFPELGPLTNIETFLGLGFTRNIYQYTYSGQGTTYSPYYLTGGDAVSVWNGTQIGTVRIPFRFGLGLAAAITNAGNSLSADLSLYSDSKFSKDFERRSEQIDWLGLVGQGTPVADAGAISAYDWTVRGSINPKFENPPPWLQRAQLQDVSVSLRWREQTIETPPPEIEAADSSPDEGYFYPDILQSPSASALLSGQILNLGSGKSAEVEEPEEQEMILRPPWETESPELFTPDELLKLPAMPGSIPAPRIPELWNLNIAYTLTPSGLLESTFNSSQWAEPADVDFSLAYSAASGRLVANIPMSAMLFSEVVGLTGSLSASGQYRTLFNRSAAVDDATWDGLLTQGYSYSSLNTTGTFSARFSPFAGNEYWGGSTVNYSMNLLLYQLVYSVAEGTGDPPYLARWIDWDKETVRTHQLQVSAALAYLGNQSLRLTADLPPRDLRFTGQLNLAYTPVSIAVSSGVLQELDDSWTVQPVTSSQTVSFGDLGQIQNQLSFNIQDSELSYTTISARIGPARAAFDMRTTEGFTFTGAGVGWVGDGVRTFRPTRVELSTELSTEIEPRLENRLRLTGAVLSGWSMNLLQYTESNFNVGLNAQLDLTDLLSVKFSSQSTNTQSYVYLGRLATGVGRQRRSLALDLLKSFNLFYRQHRIESAFNLQQISVEGTRNLEDWDLNVSYSGRPEIITVLTEVIIDEMTGETATVEQREYDWQGVLSIELQWRAIRELSSNVRADNQTGSGVVDPGSRWDLTFGNDS